MMNIQVAEAPDIKDAEILTAYKNSVAVFDAAVVKQNRTGNAEWTRGFLDENGQPGEGKKRLKRFFKEAQGKEPPELQAFYKQTLNEMTAHLKITAAASRVNEEPSRAMAGAPPAFKEARILAEALSEGLRPLGVKPQPMDIVLW